MAALFADSQQTEIPMQHPSTLKVKALRSLRPFDKVPIAPAPKTPSVFPESRLMPDAFLADVDGHPDDPPLRLILIWDNLAGHKTPALVHWLGQQGILPLYTPLSGSWLNLAEALQRIIVRRALDGQHPHTATEIITWLEETVAGWNAEPTPFVWDGKRRKRRRRARQRRLGEAAAVVDQSRLFAA